MTFLAPGRLWLLATIVALAVGYVLQQRRQPTIRHPDLDLVVAAAPRFVGWRRHLTALVVWLAVAGLVLGLARPAHAEEVPRSDAVVVLAIDTSASMAATDVSPSRFAVAVEAATAFVDQAPAGYRIGLVSFDASARLDVAPTTDRHAVASALAGLQLAGGTAAGDAVDVSLQAIDDASSGAIVGADDGGYQAIVLLSDGASTDGASVADGGSEAADAGVPVFTVSYGTADGVLGSGPDATPAPADPTSMAELASASGGTTYTAQDADQLAEVYDRITARISTTTEQVELTLPITALATAALAVAALMSLAWTPRLV